MSQKLLLRQRKGVTTSQGAQRAPQANTASGLEALLLSAEERLGQFVVQVVRDRALAEDILQETLLAAFEQRAELGAVRNPEAWLFGIARNRALHALRGRRRARAAFERLVRRGDDPPDPADAVAIRDLLVRVLSTEDRILVVLRYVHGFTATDLAAMTRLSPEAVRQRLSRARQRLLASIGDDGEPQRPLFRR